MSKDVRHALMQQFVTYASEDYGSTASRTNALMEHVRPASAKSASYKDQPCAILVTMDSPLSMDSAKPQLAQTALSTIYTPMCARTRSAKSISAAFVRAPASKHAIAAKGTSG